VQREGALGAKNTGVLFLTVVITRQTRGLGEATEGGGEGGRGGGARREAKYGEEKKGEKGGGGDKGKGA